MVRMPSLRDLVGVTKWGLQLPKDVAEFRRVFIDENVDLVHVNGAFFVGPALAARMLQLPIVWHINDTLVGKIAARVLSRWVVKPLAKQVVVSSMAVAEHYGLEVGEYEVLYAPVDVTRFCPSGNGDRRGGPVRIGVVANWHPLKGHPDLIRAVAILREEGFDVKALLFGARLETQLPYVQKVEALIEALELEAFIEKRGFVREMERALRQVDILALPSRSEACPIAVLEAMAVGIPVVGTDVGGVAELLRPDSTRPAGLVVPPGNPRAMAAGISKVLLDRSLARRLGMNGRYWVTKRFSVESCAAKHAAIYEAAV